MMLHAEISERLSAGVRYVAERLEGAARLEGSQAMGEAVQILIIEHLEEIAATRHSTAERLGATPSNFVAGAVQAASDPSVVSADADGVTLRLRHPVVARAFRDIHITPRQAESLAIPVHALAYNKRPREIWEQYGLFIAKGMIMMKSGADAAPIALYVLKKSVLQRQDRSLMPSDSEIHDAAARGLTLYVHETIREAGLA